MNKHDICRKSNLTEFLIHEVFTHRISPTNFDNNAEQMNFRITMTFRI